MVTIQLTQEEWFMLQSLYERVCRQLERKPIKRKWIKQEDGLIVNIETGLTYDSRCNKFVIDQQPNPRALADRMSTMQLLASDQDYKRPTGALTVNEKPPAESGS